VNGDQIHAPTLETVKPIRLVVSKLRRKDPPAVTNHSEKWMTPQQCADHLQIHKETLLRIVRMGKIPFVRLPGPGKIYRFQKSAIEEWGRARTLGRAK
jgi:excisionase family DNA binding protein